MIMDKYSATWVSHSSIGDFLKCPRSYFLKNVYRDPSTGHKIKLISPPLALGSAVHEVLESLSILPAERRFVEPLTVKLDYMWSKISGKKGGFSSKETELEYKNRAESMLSRVQKHPGPLKNKAVKISMDLPYYFLSPEENIILCGKIDWLEYFPESDSVHIIDFKTGKHDEDAGSLQLPIYYLLVANCQKRHVEKASYWYIERADELTEQSLPDAESSFASVLEIAKKIKLARKLNLFKCPHKTGCSYCKPMEAIITHQAEFIGVNSMDNDVYILDKSSDVEASSIIL
jgi:ATP-dependent helicase/DNAse subunit B